MIKPSWTWKGEYHSEKVEAVEEWDRGNRESINSSTTKWQSRAFTAATASYILTQGFLEEDALYKEDSSMQLGAAH